MHQVQVFGSAIPGGSGAVPLQSVDISTDVFSRPAAVLAFASLHSLNTGTPGGASIIAGAASWSNLGAAIKSGVTMVEQSGHWSQSHEPAVTVRGTTTKAASAIVRHVCTGFSGSLVAVAAIAAPIYLRLRDGATGAGTILWSMAFVAPVGTCINYALSGLCIAGTSGNAMTLEWSAAPGATNFQAVSMTGFDVDAS